ncbi:MAG: amidohydrolase family protein [Pikeienuella sp.]|uniref:amidohydrolase family protein n=1 Tax=Pikeienuella sp. TaxID=2831957 RepID=UPI00391CB3B3
MLDLDGDVDRPQVADVLIRGGRITDVRADISVDAGTPAIDATGHLVIPGLVNAHYHSHDVLLRGLFEQMPLDVWGMYSGPGNYPAASAADVRLRTLLGAADCLVNGITTVQDMVTVTGALGEQVDAVLAGYADAGIRVSLGLQIADRVAAETVPYWDEIGGAVGARLRQPVDVSALRALIEATIETRPDDRITWALAPSAPQRASDELLDWVAGLAREQDIQVFTHLYEARNQAVMARIRTAEGSLVSRLDRFGLLSRRLTIAHGVWIDDDEVARFGAAGANLACNPASNLKLLNGFAPVRRYADSGAGLALGCDNCSGNDVQSLFQSMKLFALYWGMQSDAGETGAARRAFHAATLGGARALGLEGEVGALRPGFRGDAVLLELSGPSYRPLHSALRQVVYAETGQAIRAVVVNGRIVVRNGELARHRSDALRDAAEEVRARMAPAIRDVTLRNAELLEPLLAAYRRAEGYPLPIDRYRLPRPGYSAMACGCRHD